MPNLIKDRISTLQRNKPGLLMGQMLLDASDGRQEGVEAGGRMLLTAVAGLVADLLAAACRSELTSGRGRHCTIVHEYK